MQIAVDRIWTGWMPIYAKRKCIREFIICRIISCVMERSCISRENILRQTISSVNIFDKCSLIEWIPNAVNFKEEENRKKEKIFLILPFESIESSDRNVNIQRTMDLLNVPPIKAQNPKSHSVFPKFPKWKRQSHRPKLKENSFQNLKL